MKGLLAKALSAVAYNALGGSVKFVAGETEITVAFTIPLNDTVSGVAIDVRATNHNVIPTDEGLTFRTQLTKVEF